MPQTVQGLQKGEIILRGRQFDRSLPPGRFPWSVTVKAHIKIIKASIKAKAAHTGCRLDRQASGYHACRLPGPHFGGKHMAVADGMASVFGRLRHFHPVQGIPETLPLHTMPDFAGVFRGQIPEILYACNTCVAQPLFHAPSNTGQVTQGQMQQTTRQIMGLQQGQPVGFLQVAGHLGQKTVGRDPHGAFQIKPHIIGDAALDAAGEGEGIVLFLFRPDQTAGDFVNGTDFGERNMPVDLGHDPVMKIHIFIVAGRHNQQPGA